MIKAGLKKHRFEQLLFSLSEEHAGPVIDQPLVL